MNPTARHCGRALRVLLVEDQADIADPIAMLLGLDGHDVQVARDGLDALEACQSCWPDVVLLDIALSSCDGFQVAKRIREQSGTNPRPLLVVLTGYTNHAERQRSRAEGIDVYFVKPVDPEVLLRLLQRFAAVRVNPVETQ
jgi:CheY-like chemotaxis protein